MRIVLCCLLLLGVSLKAQSGEDKAATGKLNSILTVLKHHSAVQASIAQQLCDEMMALADSSRKPSRDTVSGFAVEFTDALFGKDLEDLTDTRVGQLQSSIIDLLRGSTANLDSASRLREVLVAIHVDDSRTRMVLRRFIAIGEEVRGPDDHGVESPK